MKWVFAVLMFSVFPGLVCAYDANKSITVFVNTVDYQTSKSTLDLYGLLGYNITYVVSEGYVKHMNEPKIFILGGQNSPEGIGEIVSGILNHEEKKYLTSNPEAKRVIVVPNLWVGNQTVFVFAGYSREQTRKIASEAFPDIVRGLTLEDPGVLRDYVSERVWVPEIDPTQSYTEVNAEQAKALIEGGENPVIVDVRATPYYNVGHIPGAKNIPARKAELTLPSLDRDATYLLYCGGNSESIYVGYEMGDMGFKRIYRLVDGYTAWRKAGFPRDRVLADN
ncbi:MAG: rhodanese-like domain-containing protein [Candidatus Altiarchaeota archaeon]|nr:rhodanese-like domain-containing protein [Candidatus Altiarchaeota archaeon]